MRNRILPLVLLSVLSVGCSKPGIETIEGFAQGTTYHITYWTGTAIRPDELSAAVEAEFATIDKLLSNYRSDSVIENFNASASTEPQSVGSEIVALVQTARNVYEASQGCYDLTVKPLFDLWGFKDDVLHIPTPATLATTLQQIGMNKLDTSSAEQLQKKQADLKVDVSSIAQGYSVERLSRLLEQKHIVNYLVEIGGELKTEGHKPDGSAWRIAIERPLPDEQKLYKVVTMPKDMPMAVMTSGTYRHFFDADGQRYSHILDARTGKPVTHDLVSVTVMNNDPALADAWSTALLCLGEQQGMVAANQAKIAALFVRQQGEQLIESQSLAFDASVLSEP